MDRSLVVSQPPRSLVRLQQHVYTLVRLWLRFWIAATGLERQEKLVRRLVQHIQRRTYRTASTKYECTHHVVVTLLELWLQTLRALLVPDVFTRFLCATFVLHIVHQLQAVARQVVGNAVRRFSAKGRRSLRLQQQLEHAQSFAERQSIAGELDKVEGRDKWRADPKSNLFLYERVTNKTLMYKTLEREKDVVRLMFALRAGLLRKHWGLGNPRLYSSMNVVLRLKPRTDEEHDDLSIDNKLAFFSETRHAFGRSALMLSGGGAHGFYHAGVIKALVENNLLPNVIAGSSAGSILAGAIGVRNDDEALDFLSGSSVNLDFLKANIAEQDRADYTPSLLPRIEALLPKSAFDFVRDAFVLLGRFLDKRFLLDTKTLRVCLRSAMGDYTFREAYDRTGRIINVTVTPLSTDDYPQLLNYLTAPNVIIWSASLASCAIPNVFRPVELLAKDEKGNIVPYYREGLKWSDGSVECDLPMERLSELFNVNHFIVSQVNIHYKIVSGHSTFGNEQTGSLMSFLKKQMKAYIKNIAEFGLNTSVLKLLDIGLVPLLTQKYEGDITICPTDKISATTLLRTVMTNPSRETFPDILLAGERACWQAIARIRSMCRVEFALERAVRYLRGEQALEDERRSGRKAIGRVPSFYTSPSSMNLSNLDSSPPAPQNYVAPTTSEGKLARHCSLDHGEMVDVISSSGTSPMRRNRSMNIAGAVLSIDGGASASDSSYFDF
uniref:PNPLA domain-containing protein n=1 Tax=Hyaloperonospora arabidopsidis (strain Emoy2) TaxID=559515 RepID=M4B7J6_HYAAE